MDRRQLLFGASALGLVANLNLNHPFIAQVGNAVMGRPVCPKCGKCHLSHREWAGLRGPVKTCSDLIEGGIKSINTDYSPDGRILGYRQGGILDVDVTKFYDKQRKKNAVKRVSARPPVCDQFHYDKQGRKTRVRTISQTQPGSMLATIYSAHVNWRRQSESRMFEFAETIGSLCGGGTVITRYNENDQPIESLIRNANGELLTKINQNYKNRRLISETLVIVRVNFETMRQMEERFSENEQAREDMARARAFPLRTPFRSSTQFHLQPYRIGRFLDLKTLVWALRNKSLSLESACREFKVPGKLDHLPTGRVTREEIDYCRGDVWASVGHLAHGRWRRKPQTAQ